jgi:hypothetical protein
MFDKLDDAMTLLKVGAGLLALGVATYLIRSLGSFLGPFAKGLKWLFGLPEDVTAGLASGVRVLIWAATVAA